MANRFKEFLDIEEDFFELDKESKIATINLEFSKPSDIFDINAITKTPMLSDDFLDWIHTTFEYAPRKYKLDLNISFEDLENYKVEQLEDIFKKNIGLEFKRIERKVLSKNRIAYVLICVGLLFLIGMILMESFWNEGGTIKTIISYIFDIMTTVTFWEAMTILVVESVERRKAMQSIAKRFNKITFLKK